MTLKYHQRVFDFLAREPKFLPERTESIDALQRFLRVRLPASVVEWFSLEDAVQLIRFNDDHVLPVEAFQLKTSALFNHDPAWKVPVVDDGWSIWREPDQYHLEENLLQVIIENQGVCEWVVDLNGGDDPAVFMRWNETGERWLPCTDTFSEFMFSRVWDTRVWFSSFHLTAFAKPFSFLELGDLEATYGLTLINRPHPGYKACYRFGEREQLLSVYCSPRETECYIHAISLDLLEELVRDIWHLSDLSTSLSAIHRDSPEDTLLQRIRNPIL